MEDPRAAGDGRGGTGEAGGSPAAARRAPRSAAAGYALLLALLPLAQTALRPRWLFDGPGADPWIYYGYFRFARIYLHEAWAEYYSSRLSVILPGFLAHRALPPLAANAALHLALYACAVGAFFLAARAYAGRRGALLATVVLGSQPFFLNAIGSNYVDGFGMTYFLLALAALAGAAAARPGAKLLLAAAGACAVAIVSANLFYTIYLPLLAAHFLVLDRRGARQRLLPAAAWAAAGGALAFVGFDAAGWLWGHGSKFFLAPTLRWLADFARRPSLFKHPVSLWGPTADWLIFPVIVLAASVAVVCRHWIVTSGDGGPPADPGNAGDPGHSGDPRRGRARRLAAWLAGREGFAQLQYLAFFAAMAGVQLQSHGITLEYRYYADLLLPPACLALAVQLAPLVDGLAPRAFGWLAAGASALLALAGAGALPLRPFVALTAAVDLRVLPIALPAALGAAAVVAVVAIVPRPRGAAALAAAAAVILSLAASSLAGVAAGRVFRGDAAAALYDDSIASFAQIDRTLTLLSRRDPTLRLRLWYNRNDPGPATFFESVACAWRMCDRMVTDSFPDAAGGRMCDSQPLRAGMKLAVLSRMAPPAAAAAATRSLAALGLAARGVVTAAVPGPVRFTLLFLETASPRAAPGPPGKPAPVLAPPQHGIS